MQMLYQTLEGDSRDLAENVKHERQLRLIGPTNNGKSHLARCVAQLWVASGADSFCGRWIEAKPIKMTTMEEHLWSAREDSADGVHREVWGPLRYLWELAKRNPYSRFALILNESNRGGLFNILNAVWWEPRRAIGDKLDPKRDPPANLALIFTENPATADYSVIGGDDEALRTRLGKAATWAVVHCGVASSEREELKALCKGFVDTSNVGSNFVIKATGQGINSQHLSQALEELGWPAETLLEESAAGEQLRIARHLLQVAASVEATGLAASEEGYEDMSDVSEEPSALDVTPIVRSPLPAAAASWNCDWTNPKAVVQLIQAKGGNVLRKAVLENNSLIDNKEVVIAAVSKAPTLLQLASPRLREDEEVVETAILANGNMLQHASPKLRANKDLVLKAINADVRALTHASDDLRGDKDVMLAAVEQDGDLVLPLATTSLLGGDLEEVVLAAVRQNGDALQYVNAGLLGSAFKKVVLKAIGQTSHALKYAGDLRGDKDVVLAAVRKYGGRLKHASASLLGGDLEEVVLAAVRQNGEALQYVDASLPGGAFKNVVLTAVEQTGGALQFAKDMRKDRGIVLAAVRQNGEALQFASDGLRGDEEVVRAAMQRKPGVLRFASEVINTDRAFVLEAIKQHGQNVIGYMSDTLKGDKTFMLDLFRRWAEALKFIPIVSIESWLNLPPVHGSGGQKLYAMSKPDLQDLCDKAGIPYNGIKGDSYVGDSRPKLWSKIGERLLELESGESRDKRPLENGSESVAKHRLVRGGPSGINRDQQQPPQY